MKKFITFFLSLSLCLISCNNDNNTPLENTEEIQNVLPPPILKSFCFSPKNNPKQLISIIETKIIGDSIIECNIPHIVEDKMLIPTFEVENGIFEFDGNEIISNETVLNCTTPLKLKLSNTTKTYIYTLKVKSFTGLPIVYINTENATAITSKEDYVKGTIRIVEDIETRSAGDIFESSMKIKGRGNSTWSLPKKPYKIKFDDKTSLLGEPADKEWVLLANYTDKTSLRNETAFYMGRISNLDYTNRTHFVEVIINGVYNGTYQLGEQLKIAKNRVNVGDDGYLLEIDAKAAEDDITFRIDHIGQPINIKDPDVEIGGDSYNYVVEYLQKADAALFGENFTDVTNGYTQYLDVESFVDWYLINEISKNNDACFYSSCYMNLSKGGKLKMGPLWDFDLAFGNVNYNGCDKPEGFWVKNVTWYKRLFQDPIFVKKVKERFNYFYNEREKIYTEINSNAEYLKYAIVENNNKWNTLYVYTWPNNMIWGSYENEVQSMKMWLEKRFQWLNSQFSKM